MNRSRPDRRWIILGAVYAVLFGVILVLAYTGTLPPQLAVIPNYDKPGHLILYAVATYLGHRLLQWRRVGPWQLPLWVVLFSGFTIIEEGIQAFAPHRSFDGGDLVMSMLGIALGYWLAERALQR